MTPEKAPSKVRPTDERYTPEWIWKRCGPIGLDPCTPPHNPTKARQWYSLPSSNGLILPWMVEPGECVWVNPPYSTGQVELWARKCAAESKRVTPIYVLTSGDFTTRWWPAFFHTANACILLKDRVPYIYPGEDKPRPGSNFGNVIWCYGDVPEFVDKFGDLGYPLQLR